MIATWFIAFGALFATDICWAMYVIEVKRQRIIPSGAWAVALFLLGGVAVIAYTSDPVLLIPAAVGAFCGTCTGVWWNSRH